MGLRRYHISTLFICLYIQSVLDAKTSVWLRNWRIHTKMPILCLASSLAYFYRRRASFPFTPVVGAASFPFTLTVGAASCRAQSRIHTPWAVTPYPLPLPPHLPTAVASSFPFTLFVVAASFPFTLTVGAASCRA